MLKAEFSPTGVLQEILNSLDASLTATRLTIGALAALIHGWGGVALERIRIRTLLPAKPLPIRKKFPSTSAGEIGTSSTSKFTLWYAHVTESKIPAALRVMWSGSPYALWRIGSKSSIEAVERV